MLKEKAFANAAALTSAVIYAIAYFVAQFSPGAFVYWFDAQFLGAEISRLVPVLSGGAFIGILITVAATAWVSGYVFAWGYNKSR